MSLLTRAALFVVLLCSGGGGGHALASREDVETVGSGSGDFESRLAETARGVVADENFYPGVDRRNRSRRRALGGREKNSTEQLPSLCSFPSVCWW